MAGTRHSRNDVILTACGLALYVPAIGRYGLRLAALLVLSVILGAAIEGVAASLRGRRVRAFGHPAWVLLPLVLPPALPIWMALMSVAFAVTVTVVFFGGHGYEPVSPVAVGWTFAALSFPSAFGFGWSYPFVRVFDGYGQWCARLPVVDHPLVLLASRDDISLTTLLLGEFPQAPAAALPLLLLCLGIVLLLVRAVSARTVIAFLVTFGLLSLLFPAVSVHAAGEAVLAGSALFAALFVAGDERVCARTTRGRWLTGAIGGAAAYLIRRYASFPDGVFFAVLFANVLTPIIDEGVLVLDKRRGAAQ